MDGFLGKFGVELGEKAATDASASSPVQSEMDLEALEMIEFLSNLSDSLQCYIYCSFSSGKPSC